MTTPDDSPANDDLSELAEIISAFNASTAKLEESHTALQARVAELSGELSRKNQELSATLTEVSALKNYLANILESITDGVLAIDLEGRVIALNQAASKIIPDLPAVREGSPVAEVLPESCHALHDLLNRALTKQEQITNEEVILTNPENIQRALSVAASPIRDDTGKLRGAVQTFRDLTKMKALEERAARQERLAALGEMAAGVAHEIRNPLGGIELYASLLQRCFAEESKEAGLCTKISGASSRLNRIVEDMLTFTRSRKPEMRPIPVTHVCRLALDLAESALEKSETRISEIYTSEETAIQLDPDSLSRAFLNVILNAIQAMPAGSELSITTTLLSKDHETNSGGAKNSRLEVRFADTGSGIPEEVAENIFHPFFTTKNEGTGLGLAIVHRIVQDHQGEVRVEDNSPHGTVFVFDFPVSSPQ